MSIFDKIKKCESCGLCENQKPLLDSCRKCDVMWVGLSAKMVENVEEASPLDSNTQTGKVISEIEDMVDTLHYYKTNVVKCAPLNDLGKLRYPNRAEIDLCIGNLKQEIDCLNPKIVFLLGGDARSAVERKYKIRFEKKRELFQYKGVSVGSVTFYAVEHPSYVSIYKRKRIDEYKQAIAAAIEEVMMLNR